MKNIGRIIILSFAFLLAGSVLQAQAQSADQQYLEVQGLAITPFLIESDLDFGQTASHKITLQNTTEEPLPIEISINDFNYSDGKIEFLLAGENSNPKFSLSSWIKITKQPLYIIPPGGTTEIEFNIVTPIDAEPGTHYGGILISHVPDNVKGNAVEVTQKVGSIILAKVGKANEQADATLYAEHNQQGIDLLTKFENVGNVHLRPKGEIFIKNIFGYQVGNLYINKDAEVVMPESSKQYLQTWLPGKFSLGRYKAEAVIYYGNPKIEIRRDAVIWIMPWKKIIGIIIILLLLLWLTRVGVKRYNNWLINRYK